MEVMATETDKDMDKDMDMDMGRGRAMINRAGHGNSIISMQN